MSISEAWQDFKTYQALRNDHLCTFGGESGDTDHDKFVITTGDLPEMFEKVFSSVGCWYGVGSSAT